MGSSAATLLGHFMNLSKGFNGTATGIGFTVSAPQALRDTYSFFNGNLHGIALI